MGATTSSSLPIIPDSILATYDALLAQPAVRQAMEVIQVDDARTLEEQKHITRIPAPPFHEARRAAYLLERFQALKLDNAHIDAEGNVIGHYRGAGTHGACPRLVLCAHIDTVFPADTDLTITERDGKIFAPGIGDDARGLATMLSVAEALHRTQLPIFGEVIFLASVGEEELGDLRGTKAFFREHPGIDAFIAIDGTDLSRIVYAATGSRRYDITFRGPGGHSFNAFGLPSATHALGRAIAAIADLHTPADPKTTFTVGTVHGGTSINAIAGEARMGIDMRSNDNHELGKLEQTVLSLIDRAADEENRRWNSTAITVDKKRVGDRPAGAQPVDSLIVHTARAALRAIGCDSVRLSAASTDANVPISLGIPGVTIGVGGEGGGAHSSQEWYRNEKGYLAPQNALLMTLALAGLKGVSVPLLPPAPA